MNLPPLHAEGRPIDPVFEDAELLYRRVRPEHVISWNELNPAAISFRSDAPSVVRSKYGTPADALHSDCAGGRTLNGMDVYAVSAKVTKASIRCPSTGRVFDFAPAHDPLPTCYAHSLVTCRDAADALARHAEPTRPVKNDFRLRFAQAMTRCDTAK